MYRNQSIFIILVRESKEAVLSPSLESLCSTHPPLLIKHITYRFSYYLVGAGGGGCRPIDSMKSVRPGRQTVCQQPCARTLCQATLSYPGPRGGTRSRHSAGKHKSPRMNEHDQGHCFQLFFNMMGPRLSAIVPRRQPTY